MDRGNAIINNQTAALTTLLARGSVGGQCGRLGNFLVVFIVVFVFIVVVSDRSLATRLLPR